MEEGWKEIIMAVLGLLFTMLAAMFRQERQNTQKFRDGQIEINTEMSERLVKLESQAMTDREVRQIMHEAMEPVVQEMKELRKDLHQMNLILAQLPKRRKDEDSSI